MIFKFHSNPDVVRVTVVGEYTDGILKITTARCGDNDNFCKKTGIKLAMDRLKNEKLLAKFPLENCNNSKFIAIARKAAERVKKSHKPYKIVKQMINKN